MHKELYWPQLDSIRAISFISIFLYHAADISSDGSLIADFSVYVHSHLHLGVDVFFVLSSFLLTWLGLSERQQTATFSFKNYFTRRILRIWPLYYAIMIFAFVLLPLAGRWMHISISLPPPAWYLFFVSNFYYIDHIYLLRMLWTISVEEQFYLILGTCLKFFTRFLSLIFIFFLLISLTVSFIGIVSIIPSYLNTLTYLFNFAVGGLAAIAIFRKTYWVQCFSRMPKWLRALVYMYIPFHFILFYLINNNVSADTQVFTNFIERHLFITYVALFLVEQVYNNNNRASFFGRNKFLIFTGKLSFGLYCFHGIVLTFAGFLFPCTDCIPSWLRILLLFAATYGISVISYYYLELPFLRLKQRFRKIV